VAIKATPTANYKKERNSVLHTASPIVILSLETNIVAENIQEGSFVEKKIMYSLLKDGKFILIENVPAQVNSETGEQRFSPETVKKLQQMMLVRKRPVRTIQTPVYDFA